MTYKPSEVLISKALSPFLKLSNFRFVFWANESEVINNMKSNFFIVLGLNPTDF